MPRSRIRFLSLRLLLPAVLCSMVAGVLMTGQVWAGSITKNGPNGTPYTKLGVYQGVLTISPSSGAAVMEIGNAGRDIATTGDMYIRPGSLSQAAGARLYLDTGKTNLWLPTNSQLCLSLGTGTPTCLPSWPADGSGGGDIFWDVYPAAPATATAIRTHAAMALNSIIRIGKYGTPIPSSSGHALEIFANSLRGLQTGDLITGESDVNGNPQFGSIRIQGNLTTLASDFTVHGGYVTPYTSANHYRNGDANGLYGTGSNIDADTIDSATNTLGFQSYFCINGSNPGTDCLKASPLGPDPTKCLNGGTCQRNNLTVQELATPGSQARRTRICLPSNDSKICTGGTNPGLRCPIGNECTPFGGTCSSMCRNQVTTCAKDPVGGAKCRGGTNNNGACTYTENDFAANDAACPDCSGTGCVPPTVPTTGICAPSHCTVSNNPCSNASECAPGEACLRGVIVTVSGFPALCTGAVCSQLCRDRNVARCAGTGDPTCGPFGTVAHYTNGQDLQLNGSSACIPSGPNWAKQCDCMVDAPLEYQQGLASGNGAILCTTDFQ